MSIRLSVVVMACEERRPYVEELLESLDAPATVVWDQKRDRWDTGKRALQAHDPKASHVLCLQDDGVVCRDLVAGATRAIARASRNPWSLFYSKGTNGAHQRTNRLAERVKRPAIVTFAGPWWGVAVVIPVPILPQVLQIADRPQATPAYDRRLSGAFYRLKLECYYVLPSLVDHRIDGPSMIEGRDQDGRVAHHFIGAENSALDIDWERIPEVDGRPIVRGMGYRDRQPTRRKVLR